MIKKVSKQVAKDIQESNEEKKKYETEKTMISNKFGPKIVIDVGGILYSTSYSTLTKYPESMLGIMFSGRHAMQCEDGSFFIDRDGTQFRHILNYLRDGEEVVEYLPRSIDALLELLHEAKFYRLDGLTSLLKPLLRKIDVVVQNEIASLFFSVSSPCSACTDYRGCTFGITYCSSDKIMFKYKNMRKLSFISMKFAYAVSFIDCDLTYATFKCCSFESGAIFENCILDHTTFNNIKGLVTKSRFTGSKTDKTNFDIVLRNSLQSAGKIS